MIDTTQLTSLISAFRVETEKSAIKRVQIELAQDLPSVSRLSKESISPEPSDKACSTSHCAIGGVRTANLCKTVGKLLQDITNLLANCANGSVAICFSQKTW